MSIFCQLIFHFSKLQTLESSLKFFFLMLDLLYSNAVFSSSLPTADTKFTNLSCQSILSRLKIGRKFIIYICIYVYKHIYIYGNKIHNTNKVHVGNRGGIILAHGLRKKKNEERKLFHHWRKRKKQFCVITHVSYSGPLPDHSHIFWGSKVVGEDNKSTCKCLAKHPQAH